MLDTEFARYIRKQTRTNTTTFPDADIMLYANLDKDYLVSLIEKADEDYFGAELTRDLEDAKRKYGLPPYLLHGITKVTAMLDGENETELDKLIYDQFGRPLTEENIRSYTGGCPAWMVFGKELYILSDGELPFVSGGLKIYATIYPADLTSLTEGKDLAANPTTTSIGMPRALHRPWADLVVIDYKNSKDKPIPLTKAEANIGVTLASIVNTLTPLDTGGAFIAGTGKRDTGEDY